MPMRFHSRILPLVLLVLLPTGAAAQNAARNGPETEGPDAAAAMQQLAFLEGEWEGTGRMAMGPGDASEFSIRETARWGAGKSVLVLDGLGVERLPDGTQRPVHQAFAVLSWDPASRAFRVRAYRAGGGEVEAVPDVTDHGLVWGFTDPRGARIRFTVTVEDGVWHEVGEFSRDGATWQQFLEMELERR